jgi:hypothetical protein
MSWNEYELSTPFLTTPNKQLEGGQPLSKVILPLIGILVLQILTNG